MTSKGTLLFARYLLASGQTQTDFAEANGLHQGHVSFWVRGIHAPGRQTAGVIEDAAAATRRTRVPIASWNEPLDQEGLLELAFVLQKLRRMAGERAWSARRKKSA